MDDDLAIRTVCGREHHHDLGLPDLPMPQLDGNKTLYLMSEINLEAPVILMSGWKRVCP